LAKSLDGAALRELAPERDRPVERLYVDHEGGELRSPQDLTSDSFHDDAVADGFVRAGGTPLLADRGLQLLGLTGATGASLLRVPVVGDQGADRSPDAQGEHPANEPPGTPEEPRSVLGLATRTAATRNGRVTLPATLLTGEHLAELPGLETP
jgi:hypothetical protein